MGYFFFDESIHSRGDFILGAYVYAERDPSTDINKALSNAGFIPGQDEFKSRYLMSNDVRKQQLRDSLKGLLQHTKIGLIILPYDKRQSLGKEALIGLRKIIFANRLVEETHFIHFDQGIPTCEPDLVSSLGLKSNHKINFNQDSRYIPGLQLADLAAHCLSTMLLETLGIISKTVKAGENSGYDPELDIEIGFEMWATLRYCFFKGDGPAIDELEKDPLQSMMFDMGSYALYVSPLCTPRLKIAAEARFSKCYMGCIH